jgi:hypothetical protein
MISDALLRANKPGGAECSKKDGYSQVRAEIVAASYVPRYADAIMATRDELKLLISTNFPKDDLSL